MSGGVVVQRHLRLRFDDGDEASAHWVADADTTAQINVDTPYRIRFCLANNSSMVIILPKLYYDKNNLGAWNLVQVGGASSVVPQTSSSPGYDGTACTNQLPYDSGQYGGAGKTGFCDDNNNTNTLQVDAGYYANMEFCFQLNGAVWSDGDTVRFKVWNNASPLGTDAAAYPVITSFTVHKFTQVYTKRIGNANKFIGGTYTRIGGTGIYIGGASAYI